MKTRVLMFGWEFPPHIAGGLGTACLGLTRGLAKQGVEVLFVMPKASGEVLVDDGCDGHAHPCFGASANGNACVTRQASGHRSHHLYGHLQFHACPGCRAKPIGKEQDARRKYDRPLHQR